MKRAFAVITIGVFALASSFASQVGVGNSEPALVEVFSIPGKVTVEGAVPIPLAQVGKAGKEELITVEDAELDEKIHQLEDRMDDGAKISKRFWHKEEETTPAPHGWGAPGWGAPGWGAQQGPAMGLVGPFAFQLGAYYNPYLPQHTSPTYSSSPAYGSSYGHPPAYTTPAPSYGGYSSPSYSPPAYTTPSPAYPSTYGHAYTTPAPYQSSYGSSYTTPAPYHSSYGNSYTTPAPSYQSSYSAPSYSSPSYGYGASSSPY